VKTPDVNVLVYAHREDEAHHDPALQWLETVANDVQPFAVSSLVATAFVRIVTNRRIFAAPTPAPIAIAAIDALVALPTFRWIGPGPRHWELVSELCRKVGATGKQVADAQYAAVALEHGCEWVTFDRDFAIFQSTGLRWTLL